MKYILVILGLVMLLQACSSIERSRPDRSGAPDSSTTLPTSPPTLAETAGQPGITPSALTATIALLAPTPSPYEEYSGCESENFSFPEYPQRLIYPDYADLRQESIADDFTVVRHTTYTSAAPPADILAWYRQHALADGWVEDQFTPPTSRYAYLVNGVCTPAFEMTITVTTEQTLSYVSMDREISGPFSPLDWPED